MIKLNLRYCWILFLIFGLVGCAPPGSRNRNIPQIKLTVQNTLPIKRRDVPVVVALHELREIAPDFSFDAYLVISGQPPAEIPSQADDLNYDGQKDELVFLATLEPQETKVFTIRYTPDYPVAVMLGFHKRTRAGIFPELGGIAALESELAAYRILDNGAIQPYGKKTDLILSVETRFQGDLAYRKSISPELRREFDRNNIPIARDTVVEILKPYHSWLIHNQDGRQRYLVRKSEDDLKIYKGEELSIDSLVHQETAQADEDKAMIPLISEINSIGCGGFALWTESGKRFIVPTGTADYVRVIADGPIRSVVQRIIPNWRLDSGLVQLTSTIMIYGGNRWFEHHVNIDGLSSDHWILTGIPALGGSVGKDGAGGWLWTWGNIQTLSKKCGMGVIFSADRYQRFEDISSLDSGLGSIVALLRPNEAGYLKYYAFSLWGDAVDGLGTKEEFDEYVQITATALNTPPVLKLSSEESEKEKKTREENDEQTVE
ncbi:MAG: DUF4861 family protein [Candidatus Poribacteria bacterium]|nr:DUF4861 family protein [Candidatus Poribacteria bacterium]MDE0502698.1 DUF4861 family protein [Candidatus Poribacteria bacterium]